MPDVARQKVAVSARHPCLLKSHFLMAKSGL
jgi:hypothetical protein